MNLLSSWAVAIALLLSGAASVAQPVDVEGVKFEPVVQVGEKSLALNGAGLRTRFGLRVYAAGLYVPARSTEATVLLGQSGPRRLAITMMRDVEGETFAKALADGLRENHSDAQLAALKDRIAELDAIVRGIGAARKGDIIQFDLLPDETTRVVVNGQARGKPIQGTDVYAAVLRIWIGDKPVDGGLKKSLLGG